MENNITIHNWQTEKSVDGTPSTVTSLKPASLFAPTGCYMKWFKHYSNALDDPFITELMDRFGHLGYVAWFGLIELIAKESGTNLTGEMSFNPTYLRRKLRSSQAKLREVYEYCQRVGKVSVTFSQEKWDFDLPKMLEIKDNYLKDLQVTGKKLSLEVEKEKEEDKEKALAFIKLASNSPNPKSRQFNCTVCERDIYSEGHAEDCMAR